MECVADRDLTAEETEECVLRLLDVKGYAAFLTEALRWIQDHSGKDPRSVNEVVAQVTEGRLRPYTPPPSTLFDEQFHAVAAR